jgi:hypothetical protein
MLSSITRERVECAGSGSGRFFPRKKSTRINNAFPRPPASAVDKRFALLSTRSAEEPVELDQEYGCSIPERSKHTGSCSKNFARACIAIHSPHEAGGITSDDSQRRSVHLCQLRSAGRQARPAPRVVQEGYSTLHSDHYRYQAYQGRHSPLPART